MASNSCVDAGAPVGGDHGHLHAQRSSDEPWKVSIPDLSPRNGSSSAMQTAETESSSVDAPVFADANVQAAWDFPVLGDDSENFDAEQYMGAVQGWWPPADSWSSASESWVQPGDVVCFHDLQQTRELNGACGIIDRWDATGRWAVRLADGAEKLARPENLAVVHAQASRWWWWPSSASGRARGRPGKKVAGSAPLAGEAGCGSDSTTASGSSRSNVSSFAGEDGLEGDSYGSAGEPWTTVMMRNIPNDYSGGMLLELLDEHGFHGKFNLVYLPMDYHRKAGFGYAFIDFISTEEAQRFRDRFEGFSDWGLVSHKVCNVSWSDALQGVQAHIDRYRNSPVMHEAVPDEFKPMLFRNGRRVAFPPPTKSIRAPRLRKKETRQLALQLSQLPQQQQQPQPLSAQRPTARQPPPQLQGERRSSGT